MRPRPADPEHPPFRSLALEAVAKLDTLGRKPSDRLWRAAVAERLALEHLALGLPTIAEGFRVQAAKIVLGLPE